MRKFIIFLLFIAFLNVLPVEGKDSFSFKSLGKDNKIVDETINIQEKEKSDKSDLDVISIRNDAIAFYNINDLDNSYALLEKIPDLQKNAVDFLLMANIQQDKENLDEAISFLDKAILLDKKFYKAYYNMANIYFSKGNIENAILNYKKTVKVNRDFAFSYYNLGVCYIELGKYKTAKSYFNRAILRKDDVPDFYYNLAFAYKKLNDEKNAQKAIKVYNELIKRF